MMTKTRMEHERKLLLTTPITMDCFDIDFDSEEWQGKRIMRK